MNLMGPTYITAYTDASFCPNSKVGGWATYLRTSEGVREYSGTLQQSTSPTNAEFKAACNSLAHAIKLTDNTADYVIVLVTDCLEVQTSLRYKIKTGRCVRNNKCNKWINGFFAKLPPNVAVAVKKVKAHSNRDGARSWVNNRVDELAKIQMRSIRPKNWRELGEDR